MKMLLALLLVTSSAFAGELPVRQTDGVALDCQERPLVERFALETGLFKRGVVIGKFSHVQPQDSVGRDGSCRQRRLTRY